jgi:hypothetical protein
LLEKKRKPNFRNRQARSKKEPKKKGGGKRNQVLEVSLPLKISAHKAFVFASGLLGSTKAVGWICIFDISTTPAPTSVAILCPSPVAHRPFVVGKLRR